MPPSRVTLLARILLVSLAWLMAGCAASRPAPPPLVDEPLGVQVRRADPSLPARFVVLLGFEADTDAVFQQGGRIARGPRAVRHTGAAALAVGPQQPVRVPLASLIADGAPLPGAWTLAGAYLYADGPATVTVRYLRAGSLQPAARVRLEPKRWTPALVDVWALDDGPPGELAFEFDGPVRWLDDVVLVDNERLRVDTPAWTVREVGHHIVVRWPNGRTRQFPRNAYAAQRSTDEFGDGRLVLADAAGGAPTVLYADGRQFQDRRCQHAPIGLSDDAAASFIAQHASPGQISVPQAMGETDRLSPGDADNDGYDEASGAYRLSAGGPRLDITIAPRGRTLSHPLLQIAQLPAGQVRATMEGTWLPILGRTPDGDVLLVIPATVARPTVVSVKVQ